MTPAVLIGANVVREQRWPLLVLLAYVAFMAVLFGGVLEQRVQRDEVVFYLRQQSLYGLAYILSLTPAAIATERRSRRLLAVVSKGIERSEYLAGVLLGATGAAAIFAAALSAALFVLATMAGMRTVEIPAMFVALVSGSVFVAALALFFSTFLHPLVAAIATGAVLMTPLSLNTAGPVLPYLLPPYQLARDVLRMDLLSPWSPDWLAVASAWIGAALLLAGAARIFKYRDLAAAID